MDSYSVLLSPDSMPTTASQPVDLTRLEHLLRPLLDTLWPATRQESGPQLLFDVNIDGYRYLLLGSRAAGQTPVNLSPREQEIVRLVARGYPNKSIALVLDISPCTVATHLRRVFIKLGVNSRAEMVARISENPYILFQQ
jgi:DNA-binding CsgD family transcriptional regulator